MNQLNNYVSLKPYEKAGEPNATFMKRAADVKLWFASGKAGNLEKLPCDELKGHMVRIAERWAADTVLYNTAHIIDGQIYGLGVAEELSAAFDQLLKEKNVMCLDDSNTFLRGIIDQSDAPFVYEKLGVRFDHFLLDEFQDTSSVQWENFYPLVDNSCSQGDRKSVV